MAKPIFVGPEFLVNTTTLGQQSDSDIAILPDGRIVVTWTDYSLTGDDTSVSAVRAQVFNDDGTPAGAEILVNTTTAYRQWQSSITALDDGRFLITWSDGSIDNGSNSVIRAQIFDLDGNKVGSEIMASAIPDTVYGPFGPVAAQLSDGTFVIGWTRRSDPQTTADWIEFQKFNADGSPDGPVFSLRSGFRALSDITPLTDGRFMVIWTTLKSTLQAQIFDADGLGVGDPILVDTGTSSSLNAPRATELSDGRIVLTRGNGDVFAQILDANGIKIGTEFLVNTTTAGGQSQTSIAALPDGRFVITWTDASTSSNSDIRSQVFNADGIKVGDEFVVNTTTVRGQAAASVASMGDGRFVVTWTDSSVTGGDISNTAIRAQVFDPRLLMANIISGTVSQPQTLVASDQILVLAGGVLETQDATAIRSETPLANKATVTVAGTVQALSTLGRHDAIALTGTHNGLVTGQGGHMVTVAATGSVLSDSGNGITIAGTGNQITNLGTISGAEYGVQATGGGVMLTNSGLLSGVLAAVFTGGAADTVVNGGMITGEIKLGAGNDKYDGRLGQVTGLVSGDAGNDSLTGGDGADQLSGGAGNDSLTGGEGTDQLSGGAGNDILLGGGGTDDLLGQDGNDRLSGGEGGDRLLGGLGIDRLNGDADADSLYGGDDNDLLYGDGGNDLLRGETGADLMSGGTENDTLLGLDGNDSLTGDFGNDRLLGGVGDDLQNGGEGADTLAGGAGNDRLIGGGGADVLTGGSGRDVFVFQTTIGTGTGAGTRDSITDFAPGFDVIDLSAIDANGILTGSPNFTYLGAAAFTGAAGQLRYSRPDGLLSGDLNGDGIADFAVEVTNLSPLTAFDILL